MQWKCIHTPCYTAEMHTNTLLHSGNVYTHLVIQWKCIHTPYHTVEMCTHTSLLYSGNIYTHLVILWKCIHTPYYTVEMCTHTSLLYSGNIYTHLLVILWKCIHTPCYTVEMYTHTSLLYSGNIYTHLLVILWKCIHTPKCYTVEMYTHTFLLYSGNVYKHLLVIQWKCIHTHDWSSFCLYLFLTSSMHSFFHCSLLLCVSFILSIFVASFFLSFFFPSFHPSSPHGLTFTWWGCCGLSMFAGGFNVSIIHRTLTWTTGSLTCASRCKCKRLRTGVCGHRKRLCTESWLREKNPSPHRGIEPVSAACRSNALPTALHSHPHPFRTVATGFSFWSKHGGHSSGFSCRMSSVTFWLAGSAPSRAIAISEPSATACWTLSGGWRKTGQSMTSLTCVAKGRLTTKLKTQKRAVMSTR